ncbi:MAG TPA: amino acid--tRNA ligase-related protein [Chloroflexia bacterium]|nr:amino acid--tRNA ligase-related protein [Chloroflexia bacterium]
MNALTHNSLYGRPDAQHSSRKARVARVKAAMLRAAQDTLDGEGFTQVVAPLLTSMSGACGEPGTLIPVDLHGRKSYLRQTSQLDLEPLMRELGRVYSIGRSFRAERRTDERHLSEFTLIEAEAAGWGLEEMMALMERLALDMLHRAARSAGEHLAALGMIPDRLLSLKRPFARMTYDEAIVALQGIGHFIEWGEDLSHEDELALAEMAGGPLFVTRYPVELRFFTMKVCRDDPRVVKCCDLLLPGVGEVMGASETEADPDLLERKLVSSRGIRQRLDLGGSAVDYNWYIEMHRQESGQQAGFGMGFERLVRYACGLKSISQTVS